MQPSMGFEPKTLQHGLNLHGTHVYPLSHQGQQGSQVAERLGNRATNQKVASSIPCHAKLRCVLGQGTSPYLPRGNVPVLTVSRSG